MRTPSPPLLKAVFTFALAGMAACAPEHPGDAGDGPDGRARPAVGRSALNVNGGRVGRRG